MAACQGSKADIRDYGDVTPFQRAFQSSNFQAMCLLCSKATEDLESITASRRTAVLPQGSARIIKMTNGQSPTVESMDKEQLDRYLINRSYSLYHSAVDVLAENESMATYIPESQIL